MWKYFIHLWAPPPASLPLNCPPPPDGQIPDPLGFFDYMTVSAAFNTAATVSAAIAIAAVVICYAMTSTTLGPRFVRRWWITLGLTALVTFGAVWLILQRAPTTALAGSCELSPDAFAATLPLGVILSRSLAGLVWSMLAVFLLSSVLTLTLGRIAHARNGFFHNRGWPWPRILPTR